MWPSSLFGGKACKTLEVNGDSTLGQGRVTLGQSTREGGAYEGYVPGATWSQASGMSGWKGPATCNSALLKDPKEGLTGAPAMTPEK